MGELNVDTHIQFFFLIVYLYISVLQIFGDVG